MNFECKEIKKNLNKNFDLFLFDTIDSTNNYAKSIINDDSDDLLIISDHQTNGRGRIGHQFYSPENGFYYTLVIKVNQDDYQEALYTIKVANATLSAIEKVTGIKTSIKWVNDLYLDGKKVAGILCEARRNIHNQLTHIIIGIGINCGKMEFPDDIKDIAISLGDINKNELASQLTNELYDWLEKDNDECLAFYRNHLFVINQKVSFIKNHELMMGIVKDIDNQGNLLVEVDSKIEQLNSGEISISLE